MLPGFSMHIAVEKIYASNNFKYYQYYLLKISFFCTYFLYLQKIKLLSMKTKVTLFLLAGLMAIMSCNKDEETTPEPTTPVTPTGTMNFTKNGTAYSCTSFNNTLTIQSAQKGRRLDIRGSFDNGKILIVSVSNCDWQNPPADGVLTKLYDTRLGGPNASCQDIDGYTYCDGALGTYMMTTSNYHMTYSDETEGSVTITSCTPSEKKVSGSFSFITSDISETTFDTIQGTFVNMVYVVNSSK